jgi:hypothetical protein
MIVNYENFLLESKFEEYKKEYNSIGEWIESVANKDEYLLPIISNYINDVDVTVRISNAINLLGDFDQKQLFYRVYNYLNNGEKEKDSSIMANVLIENNEIMGGKNIFKSFLKSLTALGLSKSISKYDCDGYLLYYMVKDVDVTKIKLIFNRFKSLSLLTNSIDYTFNSCGLYFGLKTNLTFDYGFMCDSNITIGSFKFNKSTLNWLLLLNSPSSLSLKKDLLDIDMNKIIIFSKITEEIKKFNITCQKKSGLILNGDVISFGYYGVGKWDNDKLDDGEYQNLKTNFKNWLMNYKWSDKILVNLSYNSYWIYFNIKVKE